MLEGLQLPYQDNNGSFCCHVDEHGNLDFEYNLMLRCHRVSSTGEVSKDVTCSVKVGYNKLSGGLKEL